MSGEREIADFIEDMIQACEDILAETGTLSCDEFASDRRLHKAVIRDLEVLGEAAGRIPPELRRRFPGVAWRMLTAMRNRLIYGYFGVDLSVVHATAVQDLPALLPELRRLKAALDADGAAG